MPGETSKCRERLQRYCVGYGLDMGYGGDPIVPSAITVDLPKPYTNVGEAPLHLGGDARELFWFKDNVLDYVFSSHLLEDFEDTLTVLKEWLRVIKPGGYLILFCPDEEVYRKHCKKTGQPYNYSHKIDNFSLHYVKKILLNNFVNIEIIHENPLIDDYSFELVVKNIGTSNLNDEMIYEKNFQNPEMNKLPFGHLDFAEYKGGTFFAYGWAADTEDGVPVQKVMVYIDNKLLGKASMGVERPDVAQHFNNHKWLKSGWLIKANISLSKGRHTASVYAYDTMEAPAKFPEEKVFVV